MNKRCVSCLITSPQITHKTIILIAFHIKERGTKRKPISMTRKYIYIYMSSCGNSHIREDSNHDESSKHEMLELFADYICEEEVAIRY